MNGCDGFPEKCVGVRLWVFFQVNKLAWSNWKWWCCFSFSVYVHRSEHWKDCCAAVQVVDMKLGWAVVFLTYWSCIPILHILRSLYKSRYIYYNTYITCIALFLLKLKITFCVFSIVVTNAVCECVCVCARVHILFFWLFCCYILLLCWLAVIQGQFNIVWTLFCLTHPLCE